MSAWSPKVSHSALVSPLVLEADLLTLGDVLLQLVTGLQPLHGEGRGVAQLVDGLLSQLPPLLRSGKQMLCETRLYMMRTPKIKLFEPNERTDERR